MSVSNAALQRAGDDLFVAFSCHFVESAWRAVNTYGASSQTVVLQPHGDELLTSTEAALSFAAGRGQPLPILITATDRHDDTAQEFEYAGVLERIVSPRENMEIVERAAGLYGIKFQGAEDAGWMLPTVDDMSYARFGVVVSSLTRLWPTSIPASACQNIIYPNEGTQCGAVTRPAPKQMTQGSDSYALFQAVRARLLEAHQAGL